MIGQTCITVFTLISTVFFLAGCASDESQASMRAKQEKASATTAPTNDEVRNATLPGNTTSNSTSNSTFPDLKDRKEVRKNRDLSAKGGKEKIVAELPADPVFGASHGQTLSCAHACHSNKLCRDSLTKSFCKWDQLEPVCHGLYWTNEERVTTCYQPDDPNCIEKLPLECAVLKPITVSKLVEAVEIKGEDKSCQGLCSQTRGCAKSVCITEPEDKSTWCEGLYWADNLGSVNSVVHDSIVRGLHANQRVACGVAHFKSQRF